MEFRRRALVDFTLVFFGVALLFVSETGGILRKKFEGRLMSSVRQRGIGRPMALASRKLASLRQ